MEVESRFVSVNGMRLHYLIAGAEDAPPVILLHGGGIDGAIISWGVLIGPLAESHRVYATDLPGYGQSDPPPDGVAYTTAFLVETLAALVDAWHLDETALVGLSMGGATALGYALEQPDRLTRLVLVDSYGLQDTAPVHPLALLALQLPPLAQSAAWYLTRSSRILLWLGLGGIYRDPFRISPQLLRDAADNVSLEVFYEWLQSEITPGGCHTCYIDELPTLNVPTLLVHGEHDRSIPLRWARRAAKVLPNAELAVIPDAGHWSNREKPELFNRLVLDFLRAGLQEQEA